VKIGSISPVNVCDYFNIFFISIFTFLQQKTKARIFLISWHVMTSMPIYSYIWEKQCYKLIMCFFD